MSAGKVTSSAQLLLGFISGSIHRRDNVYAVVEIDPREGSAIVEAIGGDIRFRLSVVQVEDPKP